MNTILLICCFIMLCYLTYDIIWLPLFEIIKEWVIPITIIGLIIAVIWPVIFPIVIFVIIINILINRGNKK